MPVALTFNPEQTRTLERPVRRIDVAVGSVIVTKTDDPEKVQEGDSYQAEDSASLTVFSPRGAKVTVIYSDEKTEAPDRGQLELEVEQAQKAKANAEDQDNPSGVEAAEAKEKLALRLLAAHFPKASVKAAEAKRRKNKQGKKPAGKSKAKAKKKPVAKKRQASKRGDTGGSGGSLESRTLKELQATAKKRGLTGVSKLPKDKLIAKLRG